MGRAIQTTSFIDISREAGILLRGNGVLHAMLATHRLLVRGLTRGCCPDQAGQQDDKHVEPKIERKIKTSSEDVLSQVNTQ